MRRSPRWRWLLLLGVLGLGLGCPDRSAELEAHLSAGDALLRERRVEEALAAYARAAEAAPEDARPLRRRAIALVLAGRDDEALRSFEQASPLEPEPSAEELVFWATALQRSGRLREAVARYEAALEVNPRHTPALNNLAALLQQSDPERAVRLLEQAVRAEPGDAQLVYNLGRLYERMGRIEEAYNLIQRAVATLDPGDPSYAARAAHLDRLRQKLPRSPAPPDAPNLLLILVDTLRADHMSTYGYARRTTPNIDALAREAVVFENAIAAAPWTAPSVASLFTGLYPSVHGLDAGVDTRHFFDPGRETRPVAVQKALAAGQDTLAEILRRNGYSTVGFVSQIYLNSIFGFAQGFDQYHDAPFTADKVRGEVTNQRLFQWLESPPAEPFFLFVHYNDPHFPYDPPAPFGEDFVAGYEGPLTPADTRSAHRLKERQLTPRDIEYVRGLYDGEIAYVDALIGKLLDRMQDLPLERGLLTVLTADHGEEFFEHGGTSHGFTLFEEQLRVPLLLHWPGVLPPRRIDAQVRIVDVLPTLLELAGIETRGKVQGESFAALARGEAPPPKRPAFSEATWEGERKSLRTGEGWKLILDAESQKLELYDLSRDPHERRDLAAEHADVVSALERELRSWIDENQRWRQDVSEGSSTEVTLDEKTRTQLRALGYLD